MFNSSAFKFDSVFTCYISDFACNSMGDQLKDNDNNSLFAIKYLQAKCVHVIEILKVLCMRKMVAEDYCLFNTNLS